jgi:hypothetical protein
MTAGTGLLIEANLAQTGNQISAPSNGLFLIGFVNTVSQHQFFYGGSNCAPTGAGQNDLTATVNGALISVTFHENGNLFTATGTISTDGKTITGTYQGTAGCADSGTFTATAQTGMGGTRSGTLLFPGPGGTVLTDTVTGTLSTELSPPTDGIVMFTGTTSGSHNGSISLAGHIIGNTVNATGTYAGNTMTFLLVIDTQGIVGTQGSLLVNENDSIFFFCGILK